jgi:Fructosamine kinase
VNCQSSAVDCLSLWTSVIADVIQLQMLVLGLPQDPDDAASGKFGFPVDNTIGGTPQANGWMDNWVRRTSSPAGAACCCCAMLGSMSSCKDRERVGG